MEAGRPARSLLHCPGRQDGVDWAGRTGGDRGGLLLDVFGRWNQ